MRLRYAGTDIVFTAESLNMEHFTGRYITATEEITCTDMNMIIF